MWLYKTKFFWCLWILPNPMSTQVFGFSVRGRMAVFITYYQFFIEIWVILEHFERSKHDKTHWSTCSLVGLCGMKQAHNFLFCKYYVKLQSPRKTAVNMFLWLSRKKSTHMKIAYTRFAVHIIFSHAIIFSRKTEKPNQIARQLLSPLIKSFVYECEYWGTTH